MSSDKVKEIMDRFDDLQDMRKERRALVGQLVASLSAMAFWLYAAYYLFTHTHGG